MDDSPHVHLMNQPPLIEVQFCVKSDWSTIEAWRVIEAQYELVVSFARVIIDLICIFFGAEKKGG